MGTTRIQTRQGNAAGLKKLLEQIAASLPQQGNVTGCMEQKHGTEQLRNTGRLRHWRGTRNQHQHLQNGR